MFTGATISWPSPAIPKFQSGEANVQITEVSQCVWEIANRDTTRDRVSLLINIDNAVEKQPLIASIRI